MKRMVVDKNMLETTELRAWLAQSQENIVIITDYAQLEALKGNAFVNILKSTEIPAKFPGQIQILKPITELSVLKGKKKGLKKRFTSGPATTSFRKWCKTRARAQAGDKRLQQQIIDRGEKAAAQLADMLEDTKGFADNIEDATNQFTDEELGLLRRHEPITSDIAVKIFDGTMNLALKFFVMHPNFEELPPAQEAPYTFLFRMALCAYLHALRWRVAGGAAGALPERMRNDIIDVMYAAYATCFDGLMSKDKMASELYDNAKFMLENVFLKHLPPSHRDDPGQDRARAIVLPFSSLRSSYPAQGR